MFHGSIPPDMQAIIAEWVRHWDVPAIYVGCSGNFTVERTVATVKDLPLHSNDVTLYSSVLGAYFSGQRLDVVLNPDFDDEYGWLRDYLTGPVEIAATVTLASRMVAGIGKSNPYYDRLRAAYRDQWPVLHAKTVERLQRATLRLASYSAEDVMTWIERVPPDAGMISYPPFIGAAKAFARDFAKLEQLFLWDAPSYEPLEEDRLAELFARLANRRYWIFMTNHAWPEYRDFLRGITKTTNRGVPIYVYASDGPRRLVMPRQQTEPVLIPRLGPGDRVEPPLTLVPLTMGQFATLRSQYMNIHIRPGNARLRVAVVAGGKLVGCYAMERMSVEASWDGRVPGPCIYMLSDFPVAPTDYARLAKLVLYAALSRESQVLVERVFNHRARAVVTTAFTSRPVSMKYRGLFRLVSRRENDAYSQPWGQDLPPDDPYYNHRWMLNYAAELGQWTLAEGLDEWLRKHSVLVPGARKEDMDG